MVETDFEKLETTVNLMVERFSELKEERNQLREDLERSEKTINDLREQVEMLNHQKTEARSRLDGLIARLGK
jgi:septal ring factor EnvC (AmiA/AmiB activator)